MIRREISLSDGTRLWLLVSQVHHAMMSGDIAGHWQEEFAPDVIDAISHHDDGWAAWEKQPKLNPRTGAPYSFLEMPLEESLVIWDNSIAAARAFGPLAGWIVAGHFYNLLSNAEQAENPSAIAWLTAKRKVRTSWIDEWLRADTAHTLVEGKRAEQMLPVADMFSLWLCCDCPVDDGQQSVLAQSNMKQRADSLRGQFRFTVRDCLIGRSTAGKQTSGIVWTVEVDPFPLKERELSLTVKSVAAPVLRYPDWNGVVDASWPVELDWRLVPP